MKRNLFLLLALVAMVQTSRAQGYYYDTWFDNNLSTLRHGYFTPGENEITLDLSAVPYAGLHFLNIIPYYEWGEMGQWQCFAFMMPEGWPNTTDAKWMEYWVTGYDSEPKRLDYTGTEVPLMIDVSRMSDGIHILNFRTFNEVGEAGPWKQLAFNVGAENPDAGMPQNYEFYYDAWFDNNPNTMTHGKITPGENVLELDLSAVPYAGLHFLNIIPNNEWGERGQWRCIPFLMPEAWPNTSNAKWMEYWVTGYDSKPKRLEYTGTQVPLNIDISMMSYGLHFLNFRTFNEVGEPGPWKVIAFYISNGAFDREPMKYQYWIDKDEPQNGSDYTPGEIILTFSTENLQLGKHTFNYRVCYSDDPNAEDAEFGETVSVPFEITVLLGDVNSDGRVTKTDGVMIIGHVLGDPLVPFDATAADVNEDKKITITDAVQVMEMISK